MPAARKRARSVQQAQNRYDAAGAGRRVIGWNPPATGPQRAVEGLPKLRDRARDSTRNDWAGESGVQKWTTSIVGVGITPRWKDKRFTALWTSWSPQSDADGVLDIYGQQALITRSWLASGEVFLRRRSRDPVLGLSVPVQVQVIESDFVPVFDADQYQGMPVGNTIRQGIERNRFGRRVAYWMYREHPGDKFGQAKPAPGDLLRIPAAEVAHVYEPTRPGQLRGVSMLAPVLVRLRASMDFEDAVLDRQKLANLFTMFITRAMPQSWADIDTDALTGLPKWYDTAGKQLVGLEPGISQELAPGEDVKFANPPEAGTTYGEYMRTTHMGTAAGQGMPYELFSGDARETSDRTLRIIVNEFRRFAEQRQWHVVIHQACRPVVRWVAEAAALAGLIRPTQVEAFATPEWAPHGWPDLHPTQDIEGRIKARDAGFTSTSAIISRLGDDPDKVLAERQADEASGLTPSPAPAVAPAAAPAPPPPDPNAQALVRASERLTDALAAQARMTAPAAAAPAPAPHALEAVVASIVGMVAAQNQQMAAMQQGLIAITEALAGRPLNIDVAAPVVHAHNELTVPEQPAPVVNITNEIPPVEVPAPVVNVTNEVQPAAVNVDVNLPTRRIESEITRDLRGDITNVVQTERTVQ